MLTPEEAVTIPPVLDLPPAPPPKFKAIMQRTPHTGVSSDCVHKEKKQWFVLRATYGRTEKALGVLQTANVETYLPMHYVVKEINGKRKLVHEPLLPNIILHE